MSDFDDDSCSERRRSKDGRLKMNVSKPKNVRGRQKGPVIKILSSRLSSALRTPKIRTSRKASGG